MKLNYRFDVSQLAKDAYGAMISLSEVNANCSISASLKHLVDIRISQINGCAFCLNMHLDEARRDGESQDRLDMVAVWREAGDFTPEELAALAWAEALTDLDHEQALEPLYQRLTAHFSPQQIADLTLIVSTINAWNRISRAATAP